MRETQFNVASAPMHYGGMHSLLRQTLIFPPPLLPPSRSRCSLSNRSTPCLTVERQEKVGECASWREGERRGRDGRKTSSRWVAVHLSLISRETPPSSRLSTAKPPGYRAGGWERWIRPQRACPREAWFILSLFESGQHNSGPFRRQLFTLPCLVRRARHRGGEGLSDGGSTGTGLCRSLPAATRIGKTSCWFSRVEKLRRYFVALYNLNFLRRLFIYR